MKTTTISGHQFLRLLYDAGILPPKCQRIIIDADVHREVRVYYQCVGDEPLVALDWPAILGPDTAHFTV